MSSAAPFTTEHALRSRWSIPIPDSDLLTHLFESPTAPTSHQPILFDTDSPDTHQLSRHSYRSLVKRIARALRHIGLKKGDVVLVFSPNSVYFPALFLGIIAAGGIFTGANPSYTSRELAFQLQNSGARWMICNSGSLETGVPAAESVGLGKNSIFAFDNSMTSAREEFKWIPRDGEFPAGVRHWRELVSDSDDFEWERFTTPEQANTTAAINYSSGTTGVPKGVELSHKNYIANLAQVVYLQSLDPDQSKPDRRWIGLLPMYHAYGQTYYVMLIPTLNYSLYILPKFDFVKFLTYIQKYRITSIAAVPPILTALAKHPIVAKFDLSSIQTIGSGAAPLSSDIEKSVENLMAKHGTVLKIRQGWGMTEATCSVMGFHPTEPEACTGSVGELLPNCEAVILDTSTNRSLPANSRGELLIRAPNVCRGYWKNPSATAEIMVGEGWMRTGDIAYYDASGKFHIVDRIKELIKVKGNQVAPAELEGVILENPKVLDCAVIGVPVNGDEGPRAYVVKQPGADLTEEEVVEWVKERCARFKWITGGVGFVGEIPKNPSGKILRKIVREWAQKGVEKVTAKL